ncbi:MAG: DNA polymerase III subunit alpha [Oceanospirillaceae bacterium]|uniref:DNA polymerase III subunit alpha n=1 Tax=unclassified Thalassolituus TaxID=2624967 RepID=UPI000C09DB2B|nr:MULTISPECIES: DNA polymerase III subunit alpha [unclassified Thalassolituus]MAK92749.1 DNA polymerase III subunit alpha [Thalassolituus sp.]MAS25622.1 DNA polymerase III subunit alpha [Oceanospirillaceae bacterium]MAX98774.1 DNA polymerase III subunit alpha [Oceanospirillaceae bacterium]MBL35682.1 DNA polymerase III subunit alpha [Oceanospirillaceae bacterium]MBS52211.1 DNA polymerase III subunit alpha [Oceanospirillaceae bacterium]
MTQGFVHLRVHSEYSLYDSTIRVKKLIGKASDLGMPALALTDQMNMYALVKFYKGCLGAGIKPILGADLWLENPEDMTQPFRVTALCQNSDGYLGLRELISRGYAENQHYDLAILKKEWLFEKNDGLILLSGGRDGDIGQRLIKGKVEAAEQLAQEYQQHFGDRFYFEVQRTGRPGDETLVKAGLAMAHSFGIPLVATNDVRFIKADDFEAHETRVSIGQGYALDDKRRPRKYSDQQYFRSAEEMTELFRDIPSAIENTVEIAKRCSVEVLLGTYFLPDYPIPDGMDEDDFFRKISEVGLEERLDVILAGIPKDSPEYAEKRKPYDERLKFELDIIIQMGFPGYFLIVMDFIQWAKDHDIPVGPGRGSGAGSLVAYAQKITDLDPLEYDLLFERFLNPERVSMPDFDIDFCMEDREKVIAYVADNYGREAVSQIVTFGTMAAKAVVRDVARAQGKSFGLADKLSKLIPGDPGMTLEKALESEALLKEFLDEDEEAQEIWEMALKLEGIARQTGKHAGGVVIAPTKLTDFSATACEADGTGLVTQFDKNDVEEAGLVKFDFLGLRTLTIIDWALETINKKQEKLGLPAIDIAHIPLDDQPSYDLLKAAKTTAVFQLESRGMKDLIRRLQPDNIEDMIALVALFRPGPLESGMVDDFINRKHGRAQVAYPHPDFQHENLKEILEPTYGVIVYQEQVMQIAQALSGYTLGGADMLRRAMGKKKPEEMAKQRDTFREGAISQGVDPELAMKIFDLVEKFAGYGFNKSHSAAYAVVSYQTLWLKQHYPAPFMAAVLTSDMQNTDKVVTFIEECREMELEIILPDVNQSHYGFTVNDDGAIVYGLGAVKGVGEGPIDAIEAGRKDGPYRDLFDFCQRVDGKKINKRVLEALVRCGAFDRLERSAPRAVLMASIEDAMKSAGQSAANEAAGMMDLFGEVQAEEAETSDPYERFRGLREWSLKERLQGEKDTLGLFVTGHPFDEYEAEVRKLVPTKLSQLQEAKAPQKLAGLVVDMRVMKNKRGDNMCFATLDDRTGRVEVALFSDVYEQVREVVEKDRVLVVEAQISHDDYSGGLKATGRSAMEISQARLTFAKAIRIKVDGEQPEDQFCNGLKQVLDLMQDGCPIVLDFCNSVARCDIRLGDGWRVNPSDDLLQELRYAYGDESVELVFH